MTSSDNTDQQAPENEKTPSDPWRKHRIIAGILTVYVGYNVAKTIVLAATIGQSYRFLAGVMSGLGSSGIGITIPFPAIIIFVALLIGGLMFCGKRGRGRLVVWIAALISVPVGLWGMFLVSIMPGGYAPEPNYISLLVDLAISIYLIWVLRKTAQGDDSLRDKVLKLFQPKNLGIATAIAGLVVFWAYSGEISYEYNKRNWEPSDQISGLRLGMSGQQVRNIKGQPYGCSDNVCAWHLRSSKRPDLIVYYEDGGATKIRTVSPPVTGDKVPFKTVDQMREILGPEDIRSEGYPDTKYTYLKWNISYDWSNDVLTGISLGADNWYLERAGRYMRYFIKGRQVCPSEACPWGDKGELRPEYENASYKDFLSPSPEIEKMLAGAKAFENERSRKEATAGAIKNYLQKAEQGDAQAQYRLGSTYYYNGKNFGAVEDYPEAIKWLKLAAEQDYLEYRNKAQHILGKMYEEGLSLEQDYAKAIELYQLATENRYEPAMTSLGLMYMNGRGVPKDNVIAYKWFRLSWQGDNEAIPHWEALDKTLTEEEKERAKAIAVEWYEAYMARVELRLKKRQKAQ